MMIFYSFLLNIENAVEESFQKQVNDSAHILEKWMEDAVNYIPKIVGAFLIYFIGSWLVKWAYKVTLKVTQKKD